MSGSIQSAPTATMSVAGGQSGVFAVGVGYYPVEGSRCVSAQYNWTAQPGYAEDLSQLVARGVETTIQSVFIDNSGCSLAVTLTIAGTDHVVTCPAGCQGIFPVFFTGTPAFQITVASVTAAVTRLYLLNVPTQAAGVWSATAPVLTAYGATTVDPESAAPTYSAVSAFAPDPNPTDIWTITGSATKTVRIHQIEFSFSATAAVPLLAVSLIRRSSAGTGGVSGSPLMVAHDTNSANGSATLKSYTSNPGVGTLVGTMEQWFLGTISGSTTIAPIAVNYGAGIGDQALVLRGGAQTLALSLEGVAAPAGLTARVKVKWSEV